MSDTTTMYRFSIVDEVVELDEDGDTMDYEFQASFWETDFETEDARDEYRNEVVAMLVILDKRRGG